MNEYVIGGGIALVILAGIAYGMLRKRKKPQPPSQPLEIDREGFLGRRNGDRTP